MAVLRKTPLLLHLLCASAFAQPASFDVADVHLSPPTLDYHRRGMGGPSVAGDHLYIHRATMLNLIALAWNVSEAKVLGGPTWIDFERFDVRAKVPPDAKFDTIRPMLRALLAERFGLEVHEGSKEAPGWALTAAKTTQLRAPADSSQRGCRSAGNGPGSGGAVVLNCSGLSMAELASDIPGGTDYIDEEYTVEDRTGLTGDWAFTLRFAPSKSAALSTQSPTLFDALDQIGLKLEPARVTVKGIVVDRVNRQPAANPSFTDKQQYFWLHMTDTPNDSGAEDLAVDTHGNLYVATRMGIQVCDQNGRVRAILRLPTPSGPVRGLCFGGEHFDILYVTDGTQVFMRRLKTPGHAPWSAPVPVPSQGAG
jgi:uncharacterized protein (TIGR03435 family)